MDKRWNNIGINDGLDLGRVTGSDIGNGPASLLSNSVLPGAQEREKGRKSATVDDDLGLDIIASNNVANRSKSWGLNGG